jgi:hypothetical protein
LKPLVVFIIIASAGSNMAAAQPIVGLGELKIGMSEEEFLDVPDIKRRRIIPGESTGALPWEIFLFRKTSDSMPAKYRQDLENWKIFSPDHTQYELSMAVGVKDKSGRDLYKTWMSFYKTKLVKILVDIKSESKTFIEIIETKYGAPVVTDRLKKEVCEDDNGKKTEYYGGSMDFDWGQKAPITASVFFSSFCGSVVGRYEISDRVGDLELFKIELDLKKYFIESNKKSKAEASKL